MRLWRNVVLTSVLAVLLAMGVASPGVMAAPGVDGGRESAMAADSDGDGIPDDLDPDDDNDGISDEAEAGPNPQPDNGGIPDGDGDQIPDDLDPDDNNNGVTDDDEASAPPPSNGGGNPGGSDGGANGGTSEGPMNQGSSSSSSLVQALPATGTGDGGKGIPVKAFAVTAVLLTLLATIPVANRSNDRPRR